MSSALQRIEETAAARRLIEAGASVAEVGAALRLPRATAHRRVVAARAQADAGVPLGPDQLTRAVELAVESCALLAVRPDLDPQERITAARAVLDGVALLGELADARVSDPALTREN